MTNDELIQRAQAGEHSAFDQLYQSAYAPVYRFIYLRTRSKDEAEDLTQEVFIKMLRNMPESTNADGSMLPYLFTVARNTVIDWTRKKKPVYDDDALMSIPSNDRGAEEEADLDTDIVEALNALETLSDAEEGVLKLRFLDGLSNKEVATLLGKSEEAVRQAVSRGLRHLRSTLEGTKS